MGRILHGWVADRFVCLFPDRAVQYLAGNRLFNPPGSGAFLPYYNFRETQYRRITGDTLHNNLIVQVVMSF